MNFFDKLEEFLKKDFSDSLNRSVYAKRHTAFWAPKKPSRPTAFVDFFSATFLRLLERFAFLYRNRKNVVQPER
jgi:hypothetical protein